MKLNDPRPNGERLLATGAVQEDNASDYLLFEAELVKSDRLYTSKHEVLQSLGIQVRERSPPPVPTATGRASLHLQRSMRAALRDRVL